MMAYSKFPREILGEGTCGRISCIEVWGDCVILKSAQVYRP